MSDYSSQNSADGVSDVLKSEDLGAKINGLSEDSAETSFENGDGSIVPNENGLGDHAPKTSLSSHKHGDWHHKSSKSGSSDKDRHTSSSSSSKNKDGSSSSSTKHSSSSSKDKEHSSSKHRDGHSSSSSKNKEGSRSHHNSNTSSAKHRDGSKEKSSSSSSKSKDGTSSSSSPDKHSNSSKSKESSSKHKDSHSSSNSKSKEGSSSSSSSKAKSSSSSSTDKLKDKSSSNSSSDKNNSNNTSSDKNKDKSKESNRSSDKDKPKPLSSSSSKSREGEKRSSSEGDKQKSLIKAEGSNHGKSSSSSSTKSKVSPDKLKAEVKVKLEVMDTRSEESMEVSPTPVTIKKEEPSSPQKTEKNSAFLVKQPAIKSEDESEDDDKPLSVRKKESKPQKRKTEESDYEEDDRDDDDEDSDVPLSLRNKAKKLKLNKKDQPASSKSPALTPKKKTAAKQKKAPAKDEEDEPANKKKKGENEETVWKWWEEVRENTDIKWKFLEHKGPVFAPPYEPLPKDVRFYYDGKPMHLSQNTEEVAVHYGRMLDHEYTTRDVFNNNFMKDWRKVMTAEEKAKITDIKKCNFTEINEYFKKKTEERKAMSKEEKQNIKKQNETMVKEYGFCIIDKHKEKIGNFKIEPPGLFRGRGDHPKQGMLKLRVNPEDIIINCSKDSKIPVPPPGHKWKEVRHDNTVTWLASWTENIQGATKYIMLNAASKLKGEKDWQKYETARKLHKCVDRIRAQYQEDWRSKEMRIRQRAVALYFIDKLALRAGNEKEEGETADTVGCCSLRVEHITLHNELNGKQNVVEFDFLGKDSIRYQNAIPVEKRVFKNLQLFMENKQPEDDLFDRLNTTILNKHLQDLMEGLTAKVFRTFNASKTLSEQLELLTNPDDTPAAKMLAYNRANRAVAILCNHQRAVPKTFEKSMENLNKKIDSKRDEIKEVKKEIKKIKAEYKREKSVRVKTMYEKKKKTLDRLEEQLSKLDVMATDKDENKEIALSTSKLNYLDPRISVSWCKKYGIPVEKVYNKTQRDKFRWAIDMADQHFKF